MIYISGTLGGCEAKEQKTANWNCKGWGLDGGICIERIFHTRTLFLFFAFSFFSETIQATYFLAPTLSRFPPPTKSRFRIAVSNPLSPHHGCLPPPPIFPSAIAPPNCTLLRPLQCRISRHGHSRHLLAFSELRSIRQQAVRRHRDSSLPVRPSRAPPAPRRADLSSSF